MENNNYPSVRLDGYSRFCLTAIAVLLTLLVIGLWAENVGQTHQAVAAEKFLDTSAQRQALLDAQKQTNVKLDELIRVLKSGEVKVRLADGGLKAQGGGDVPKTKKK